MFEVLKIVVKVMVFVKIVKTGNTVELLRV